LVVKPGLDCDSFAFEVFDRGVNVIAEQIELVTRLSCLVGMHATSVGGSPKISQPPPASTLPSPSTSFKKVRSALGVTAVNDYVSPVDHSIVLLRVDV